ncbi:kinase domain-containing protein [Aspergillus ibericus CBS 121593]|uniref:non-specific serine/threonine protein kinase n=1 Tax=Aspergillus ibericus CBS 121593 TaxID=1448316 RepID=A0A395GJI4_9EURO|nr:kinase domain-containing protein [Aspergillus ibericus CBS 121593]RAK95376.1 kinase domain-containing protein [Aspergillus ibericus CBS 121593]
MSCSGEIDESDSFPKYNWIDGTESLEKYRPGGYHPVMIGDLLHGRYHIVDKLGYGGYSTVWLARDTRLERYVAVKVGIANSLSHETKTLRVLSAPGASSFHPGFLSIPSPLDEFELTGPNGTHPCYTMTPARCNLREVSYSRLFPLDVARALSGGLVLAIAYIHSKGYIHGDIHLRNILVKLPSSFDSLSIEKFYEEYGEPEIYPVKQRNGDPLPPNVPPKAVSPLYLGINAGEFTLRDTQILLGDFGEAFSPTLQCRRGQDCHTPFPMRPPEARFEPQTPLSYSADIWSLAVAIWEILGMKAIFSMESPEEEVIAQQIHVLGPMPGSWFSQWEERGDFFEDDGRPVEGQEIWPAMEQAFEEGVRKYRQKKRMADFDDEETAAILALMRRMLKFRPEERLTIDEVMQSEWMVKWALPEYERSLQAQKEQ